MKDGLFKKRLIYFILLNQFLTKENAMIRAQVGLKLDNEHNYKRTILQQSDIQIRIHGQFLDPRMNE